MSWEAAYVAVARDGSVLLSWEPVANMDPVGDDTPDVQSARCLSMLMVKYAQQQVSAQVL